jgi:hypothetical protein
MIIRHPSSTLINSLLRFARARFSSSRPSFLELVVDHSHTLARTTKARQDGRAPMHAARPSTERGHAVTTYRVGYLVGSLASDSINRKLAAALVRLAPSNLEFTEISIKDLPLYSRDFDDDFPAEARALKEAITSVDALLFVTPEYTAACLDR